MDQGQLAGGQRVIVPNVEIRRLGLRDIDAAFGMTRSSWVVAYSPIFGEERASISSWSAVTRLALFKLWWHALGRFPANAPLVACMGGRLSGFLYGQSDTRGDLLVWMLYIDPAHLRMGIGLAMLQHFAGLHPRARSMRLEVLSRNQAAIGFEVTGRLDQGDDAYSTVYMEQALPLKEMMSEAAGNNI